MVIVTSPSSCLHARILPFFKPIPQFLQHFKQIYPDCKRPSRQKLQTSNGVTAYMECPNSISSFANKEIGSLPVTGLVARILSDEGGVGGDIIDFADFRRRVGKKCTITDSRAFYEFQDRRGRILEGVARLRLSNDIELEEQNFLALMNDKKEKRAKTKTAAPAIPMEVRAEKALEAIYICCYRRDLIEKEDKRLLNAMLSSVFQSVEQSEIQRIVVEKARKVADGSGEVNIQEPKPLPKEAVKLQMKDLQFLKQN